MRGVGLVEEGADGFLEAVVDVDSNLPADWRARGRSDNGVLAVEPVTFRFPPAYPLAAPQVFLRDGFDRAHPHVQPRADGRAEPCLVNGSPAEVLRSRSIFGLVDQLALWLDRAAMLSLMDPSQGWEPTRRDYLLDIVALDRSALQALALKDAGCRIYEAFYGGEGHGAAFAIMVTDKRVAMETKAMAGRIVRQGDHVFGRTLTLVAWSGKLPSGSPFVADRYMPEDVDDVASLHARAQALGCAAPLAAHLDLLRNRGAALPAGTVLPIGIVLLARRPFNLVGTGSPIECCPYILTYRAGDDLGPNSKVAVRPAAQRDQISTALLRFASGQEDASGLAWSLLGCGSVGSKIAAFMARCGRAPGLAIDRSTMAPHNFSRHSLLPATGVEHFGFVPKAELVATALSTLGSEVKAAVVDIVSSEAPRRKAFWSEGADMLVNATGSLVVREALSAGERERPRVVEACLLAAGKAAYFTVEGPGYNPSTSDLASEYYRLASQEPEFAEAIFGAEAQRLAIGQGCSSVTFPMSDSSLSAMTAPMATRLAGLHSAGLPSSGGEVVLGRLSADGYGQVWRREAVAPFSLATGPQGWSCRLRTGVCEAMRDEVAARPGKETGGVLIGRWSDVTGAFCVVDLMSAPPDSAFRAGEFVLGTEGLRGRLDNYVRATGGSLYALGTWHNHLVASGPSPKDIRTGLLMAAHQVAPILMVIHAPDGLRFFVSEVDDDGRSAAVQC